MTSDHGGSQPSRVISNWMKSLSDLHFLKILLKIVEKLIGFPFSFLRICLFLVFFFLIFTLEICYFITINYSYSGLINCLRQVKELFKN